MKTLGVYIGRFQAPRLTRAHQTVLQHIIRDNAYTLVLVGEAPVLSTRNPIPARLVAAGIRELINRGSSDHLEGTEGKLLVDIIKDHQSDYIWAENVNALVKTYVDKLKCDHVVFYGGRDSCIDCLRTTGWCDIEYTEVIDVCEKYKDEITALDWMYKAAPEELSGTEARAKVLSEEPASEDVRSGFILSAAERYPTVYSTVDVVLFDSNPKYIWLGQKYKAADYCFIGGFVDPIDDSRKVAALRELNEETGYLCFFATRDNEVGIQYIGDHKIDDWRYRGTKDCIMTSLFLTQLTPHSPKPKASDDMMAFHKVNLEELPRDAVAPQHRCLYDMLMEYLNNHKNLFKKGK